MLVFYSAEDDRLYLSDDNFYVNNHKRDQCAGEFCCLHNPSDHPLKDAQLNWRADRGIMERICEHGIGHDDLDDLAFRRKMGVESSGIHGCDGCCSGIDYSQRGITS